MEGVTTALNWYELADDPPYQVTLGRTNSVPLEFVMVMLSTICPTFTEHVAVLPLYVFTVMVAEPAAIPLTFPAASTVATEGLEDVHVTSVLVAFEGEIMAFSCSVFPVVRVREVLSSFTPETAMTFAVAVTSQVAVKPPSSVVTVMVAVPSLRGVTAPSWPTFTMLSSEELQVTFLFVASAGWTVAMRVPALPMVIVRSL